MPVIYSDEKQKYVVVCYCGAAEPVRWTVTSSYDDQGKKIEWCDTCSTTSSSGVPDVYWDGKPEKNLVDDHGKPMEFLSKGHKARWLKEKGLVEAGGRFHGGTAFDGVFEKKTLNREAIRMEVRESLRKVRAMSRSERSREVTKILQQRYEKGRQHA